MAPSFSTPLKFLFSSLLLIICIMVCEINCETQPPKPNQTLVFFLQDVASGPNATVSIVTGINGRDWSYNTFGTIFVVDDPVMLSASPSATQVGRAQGMLIASSLDGSNVSVVMSIVFNSFQYSESTLEIQGISRQRENYRELSVVSGTGRFRYAKGTAGLETLSYDAPTTRSIIRLTITLV
ncbi:Dirigent protein [Sesbania bispinosa]|nr:Dirigent protein [Sesbania bispinosa]